MKRGFAISIGFVVVVACVVGLVRSAGKRPDAGGPVQRRILYYVDPMHPAYRSDKPGIAPDCGMDLEPVYEDQARNIQPSPVRGTVTLGSNQVRLLGIQLETARRSTSVRTIRTTGRVVADENHLYRIQAGFDGWVDSLNNNPPGAMVHRDEILASLYGPEVRNAENNYLSFVSGVQRLKQNMSESDVKNIEDSGHINEEQLRLLGMGDTQIRELGNSRRASSMVHLVAPGDGVVLLRNLSQHQRFERGSELYRIADLRKVWIMADAHGGDGDWKPGSRVHVHVPELSRTLEAVVANSTPLFDEPSRSLKIRLEADNPGMLLRPDMFVDVVFEAPTLPGLTIPAEAVVDSGTRKIVYVQTGEGVFEPRPVQIGDRIDNRVQVTEGLTEGESVVISGNFLLDSESRMRLAAEPKVDLVDKSAPPPATDMKSMAEPDMKDPVCGMTLKPSQVAFRENYKGRTVKFCSDSCRRKFLADPKQYAAAAGSMKAENAREGTNTAHD